MNQPKQGNRELVIRIVYWIVIISVMIILAAIRVKNYNIFI